MDRRTVLGAGLLTGLSLTLPATAEAAGTITSDPSTAPAGATTIREYGRPTWPIVEWSPPRGALQAPKLAVYRNNLAYADADTYLPVPPIWTSTLQEHAQTVLSNPSDLRSEAAGPPDHVRVRTAAGDYLTTTIPGWHDGDPAHAYPPDLRELYEHVMGIRRHVRQAGLPWYPAGAFLAAVTLARPPKSYRDWPRELPTPTEPYQEFRLPGRPATLPRARAAYCLRTGRFVAAAWRPLLPHELD